MLVPMVLANRGRPSDRARLHGLLGAGRAAGLRHRLLFLRDDRRLGGEDLRAAVRAGEVPRGVRRYGIWVILIKGLTPIPYKLVTIASGAAHFDLFTFVWASIVTRGARFFLVAALLWKFGEPIRAFIEKRLTLVMWLFLIVLVGGFVAVEVPVCIEVMSLPYPTRLGLIAALGSIALLGGAYYFQYVVGLAPCDMCLVAALSAHAGDPAGWRLPCRCRRGSRWCGARRSWRCSRPRASASSTPASNIVCGRVRRLARAASLPACRPRS